VIGWLLLIFTWCSRWICPYNWSKFLISSFFFDSLPNTAGMSLRRAWMMYAWTLANLKEVSRVRILFYSSVFHVNFNTSILVLVVDCNLKIPTPPPNSHMQFIKTFILKCLFVPVPILKSTMSNLRICKKIIWNLNFNQIG
jgi:hypothetical protein